MKDTIWQRVMNYGLEFLGLYYGSYRAFVVDNQDPNKMNRLQLNIPHLNATVTDETWAWPKSNWGGNGYGVQMLPRKGDMVWVEFEYGNADYPVWSHASYAEKELPGEFISTKHYGFKTPGGSLVVINDNKGEEELLIRLNNKAEWVKVNKEKLEVEAKLIKLGKNGDEQAVMGETLKTKMEDIMEKLDETYQAILAHKHSGPGQPPTPDDVTKFTGIKTSMSDIKGEFGEYLSDKVKIDK